MSIFEVVTLALTVINKLYPIAREIYEAVNDPGQPDVQPENALELIRQKALTAGFSIGHTEAELVRSAIHFAKAKANRHNNFITKG